MDDEPEDESDFAGPELPPDFEEDVPDDEDGRFFGGGMAKETAQAMDYLDRQDQDGDAAVSLYRSVRSEHTTDTARTQEEKIDIAWVRRLALNFEKRISKNAELRAKFENDPQKCVPYTRTTFECTY